MATRPDLNGHRMSSPETGAIYLIDEGLKRHVVNAAAMENIFADWTTTVDAVVEQIDEGPKIDDQTVLVCGFGQSEIYLIDRIGSGTWIKRYVRSPEAMAQYNFAWSKVHRVPLALVAHLDDGPEIG